MTLIACILLATETLVGVVQDVFVDEVDPGITFFVLECSGTNVYAAISRPDGDFERPLKDYLGAEMELSGSWGEYHSDNRRYLGWIFKTEKGDAVRVLKNSVGDLFNAPELKSVRSMTPLEIGSLGRCRTMGQVIAVMHGGDFLLAQEDGYLVRVECVELAPKVDDFIEVTGFPESNIYFLSLRRAFWRSCKPMAILRDGIFEVDAYQLTHQPSGAKAIQSQYHGRTVRLSGSVLDMPSAANGDGTLYLDLGGYTLPVEIGNLEKIPEKLGVGCRIEIIGICIVESDSHRSGTAFPHLKRFLVVVTHESDIKILSTPSWWTAERLLIALFVLLPVILVSIALNFVLRKMVERKSRQLLREQSAKLVATLRVDERTRLAAELHDSIAQTMTGISMQMETAVEIAQSADKTLKKLLDAISRGLLNCRDELRLCLWDLRSQAMDEPDLETAIRYTLKPLMTSEKLFLRFKVKREKLSDSTVHATLRIIRELVSNAIRHGNAKELRISGALDNGRLYFAVSDDGCGFDPQKIKSAAEGHFGLTGIRERLRKNGGTLEIEAHVGKGARMKVMI